MLGLYSKAIARLMAIRQKAREPKDWIYEYMILSFSNLTRLWLVTDILYSVIFRRQKFTLLTGDDGRYNESF